MRFRSLALCTLPVVALSIAHAPRAVSAPEPPAPRWTDATPDAMIDDAAARALATAATEHARTAAIAVIAALADRAEDGRSQHALERIAAANGVGAELRAQAALLARSMASDEGTDVGAEADRKLGVVDALAILGPLRDTGGGLDAHDGPESVGQEPAFDPSARYSWGTYEVAWREVPRAYAATAGGVPLDLFVFPRKESCTWLATKLTLASAQPVTVSVASAGQVRVVVDGADVARDDAVHAAMRFDRAAARVEMEAGDHLVAAKVCSGAIDDEGRARLRLTGDSGAWPEGARASADLRGARGARAKRERADRKTTALTRALVGGKDLDVRLDDCILRTLGGADDSRSPRAPGLLATLASSPALDADRLAMAAWIAPSGASRSAWLHRARDVADAGTHAFVERRLVERHMDAGLPDWAMTALRGAGIEDAKDAEAALIAAQVDAAVGVEPLRIRAMRRLAAVDGARAPDAVLIALASLQGGLDPAGAAATREALAARGYLGAARVASAASHRGREGALLAARPAFERGLDSADEAVAVAQTVAQSGAHAEARALFEQVVRFAPNHAAAWAGLAQEIAAGPGDATREAAVAAALRRARELDPGEARYRAEIALRAHAPSSGDARDDEKYMVASQTILARRRGAAADVPARSDQATASKASAPTESPPDVADRELHWLRVVTMHPDRRVSELVHYAREIVIGPRTEQELYEDVPSEGDLTEIVRARVHRRDGAVAFPVEESNDDARPRIRWPDLHPGDVVEVAFRSWSAGPVGGRGDPPFYRIDYAGARTTHPLLYNEVVAISPKQHPIYVDVVNGKPDRREESDAGGTHVVRLVWDKPVNVPDEPLAPPMSEVLPTLVLSTFKDWSDFRAWYGEAVRGFTEPDAEVREIAAKLTKNARTRDEKLRAIFEFVADDIRYVNYVSGEWWLPNRPQQLLARREGDCDDKALLLITLLKTVGIDAQEVMVQTRMTSEPSVVRARGAAVPLFDHGIAFLPDAGGGGGRYLDATSPQSRLGPLPSMDARAVALRMDGPPEIVQLPSSSPDDHGIDATWTIALRADGAADIEGEERGTGDDAFWMRTYLTEAGGRAQWIEDRLVGGWFSTIEVDKKVDFRGDLPRGAASAKWRAHSDQLARKEGRELVVPLSPSQTTASQIAPLVKRTLAVWLPPHIAPRKESRTIRVVAPKGWSFEALPLAGEENGGAFGRAALAVSKDAGDPRAIVVKRTVVFDQSVVSVDEYAKWRAWVQRVDALMHKTVRLAPITAGAR